MTLSEFVASVPKGIRLGQHFHNIYIRNTQVYIPVGDKEIDLFYITDPAIALIAIENIMKDYQWSELPE